MSPTQHPEAPVATGPAPTPELGETMRVVSKDTVTLRFQWNSRVYVLPPGGEAYMPFDAVKCYTGDPRATSNVRSLRDSIGIVSFLPDRETEVRRLRLLYMAPFGEYMAAENAGGIFQPTKREHVPTGSNAFDGVRTPQVEVYNIQGQRVTTVLDDPEGDTVTMAPQTNSQVAQYERVVMQQQNVINAMAERLGIDPLTGLTNSPNLVESPPEDENDQSPEHMRVAPSVSHVIPDDDEFEYNEDGTPIMVFNPESQMVEHQRKPRPEDPTSLNDLPEDRL